MGDTIHSLVTSQKQLNRQTKLLEQSQNQAQLLAHQNALLSMQNDLLASQCQALDWMVQAMWRMEMRQINGPDWKPPPVMAPQQF